jgi:hypothetical protein
MKLRVDQAVMLGVVGLGLLAAVSLFSGGGRKEPRPENTGPGLGPNAPPVGPDKAAGGFPRLLQNQTITKTGVRYWGRLDYGAAPSRADIVAALTRLGLGNATVYESLDEAKNAIPEIPLVLENATAGTRWFQADAIRGQDLAMVTPHEPLTYLWIKAA